MLNEVERIRTNELAAANFLNQIADGSLDNSTVNDMANDVIATTKVQPSKEHLVLSDANEITTDATTRLCALSASKLMDNCSMTTQVDPDIDENCVYSTTKLSTVLFMTDNIRKLCDSTVDAHVVATDHPVLSNRKYHIILDSGASSHMLPEKTWFTELVEASGRVKLGNNTLIPINGIGDTTLLNDVLYVPDLYCGLISIGKLDKAHYTIVIYKERLLVYNRKGEMKVSATLINNLYHLDDEYYNKLVQTKPTIENTATYVEDIEQPDFIVPNSTLDALPVMCCSCAEDNDADALVGDNELQLLHNRLGHLNEAAIKSAVKHGQITGVSTSYDTIRRQHLGYCEPCYRGKMRTFNRTGITKTIYQVLEKIGVDYKGPFKVSCIHKHKGYIILSDQASHYIKIYPVTSRSEALECFKDFLVNIVLATNHEWKILQTDNDTAFLSKSVLHWLARQKIRQHLSAPYKHSQNGMVERDIQTIMNDARAVMAAYDCPHKYWCYAVQYAVYNHNRLRLYDGKTPHERVYHEKPDMSHAVPFYAPGVYHLTTDERPNKAWSYKAEPCRMLGYSDNKKATYIVLRTKGGKVLERHDCRFNQQLHNAIRDLHTDPSKPPVWEYVETYFDQHYSGDNTVSAQEGDDSSRTDDEFTITEDKDEDEDSTSSHLFTDTLLPRRSARIQAQQANYLSDWQPYAGQTVCCIAITESTCTPLWEQIADCFTVVCDDLYYLEKWVDHVEAEALIVEAISKDPTKVIPQLPQDPKSLNEALTGPDRDKWIIAILEELKQMEDYGVFGPAEQTGRGMKMKLVLKVKYENDFSIRYKARLVGCGYSQIYGVDYQDTYAPTVSVIIINLVLHLLGIGKYCYYVFDVKAAFLEAENDFENYAYLPAELLDGISLRVRLLKSLYGEKQAARLWSEKLSKILVEIGFNACPDVPTLYRLSDSTGEILVITHVDDGLVVSNSQEKLMWLHVELNKRLKEVKMTQPVKKFLGCLHTYDQENGKITLSQSNYIQDLSTSAKSSDLPIAPNLKLRKEKPNPNNKTLLPETGKLRYIADRTRWDIATAVGEVSSGGEKNPSDKHVETCEKIKSYLLNTINYCLCLGGSCSLLLFAFCDAAYNTDKDCKSRLGGCIFGGLDSGAIYSFSTNSTLVAQSSTHAEIMAIFKTVRIIIHIRNVLKYLGRECVDTTVIYVDNKSAIEICEELRNPEKTGSINTQIHSIREHLNNREIKLVFIPTRLNVADIMTKGLPGELFRFHANKIQNGFGGKPVDTVEGEAMVTVSTIDELWIYESMNSAH